MAMVAITTLTITRLANPAGARAGCGRGNLDRHLPSQLLLIEWRAASEMNVHLELGGLVDQIGDPTVADRPQQRLFDDVELGRQPGDKRRYLFGIEGGNDVDSDRRARFASERTGDRSADGVGCADRSSSRATASATSIGSGVAFTSGRAARCPDRLRALGRHRA